ncbi:MAG: hypothetical protein KKI08_19130, partial [Armatimonadetes bacterium]|nr:hypothetical protein [Armatimonadota bacterium]
MMVAADAPAKAAKRSVPAIESRIDGQGSIVVLGSLEVPLLHLAPVDDLTVARHILSQPQPRGRPPVWTKVQTSDKGVAARLATELLGGLQWSSYLLGDDVIRLLDYAAKRPSKGSRQASGLEEHLRCTLLKEMGRSGVTPDAAEEIAASVAAKTAQSIPDIVVRGFSPQQAAEQLGWSSHENAKRFITEGIPRQLLFLGSRLHCSHCEITSWLPLSEIGQQFVCPVCLRSSNTPPDMELAYELEPGFARAVRYDQLVPLAACLLLSREAERAFGWLPELTLSGRGSGSGLIDCDLDLLCFVDGRVVIGECARQGRWSELDFTKLRKLAEILRPSEVVLASLLDEYTKKDRSRIESLRVDLEPLGVRVTELLGHHLRQADRNAHREPRFMRVGKSSVVHDLDCRLARRPGQKHEFYTLDREVAGFRRCKVCLRQTQLPDRRG